MGHLSVWDGYSLTSQLVNNLGLGLLQTNLGLIPVGLNCKGIKGFRIINNWNQEQESPEKPTQHSSVVIHLCVSASIFTLGKPAILHSPTLTFPSNPQFICLQFQWQTWPGFLSSKSKFKGDSKSQLLISVLISYNQRGKVMWDGHGPNVYMNVCCRGQPSEKQWPWAG